jgi:4-hydroxythreonine-4-phosphate dehydrogenase
VKKKILVTCGDPSGIGPDLCINLAFKKFDAQVTVIGSSKVIYDRAQILNKQISFNKKNSKNYCLGTINIIDIDYPFIVKPGIPNKKNSKKQLQILDYAISLAKQKKFDAIVTLPINKNILSTEEEKFIGHTEYIAKRCKIKNQVMMLATNKLRVALLTTHYSIKEIPSLITKSKLKKTVEIINYDLKNKFKIKDPKILITGLNPHAGENGEFGEEERKIILPVINELKKKKISIDGPVPADTAFVNKNIKKYDVILAMYHDQGLAPFKALSFGKGVNITLGLPFVRTSVDHGTAYDIVGTKKIDSSSFFEAIKMAIKLS